MTYDPSAWEQTTFGDVVDFFDRQRIPLSGQERKGRQGPFPYYGASGIIDYIDDYIFDGRYLLIAEDGENLNSRKTPIAFFAEGKFWVNNHAHVVRAKANRADDYFLKAWFDQANISGYITGAAQPKLSQANLRRIELRIPPFPIQRRVTAILSAYDDLIENNLRRIKILEEMAQALYREWFVKFRFPGHEKVRMVDSPLGEIPEGWEVVPLKAIVECVRQSTRPGEHLSNRHYVPIDCLPKKSLTLLDVKPWQEAKSSLVLFEEGDILFGAMRPYFHKVVFAPFQGVTRTTCFVLRPKVNHYRAYGGLVAFQEETVAFASAHSRGATIPYAVWDGSLAEMKVVLPGESLLRRFSQVADPILRVMQGMFARVGNLRRTRDLLLPRLISGQIDVSDLDIDVGEEAA